MIVSAVGACPLAEPRLRVLLHTRGPVGTLAPARGVAPCGAAGGSRRGTSSSSGAAPTGAGKPANASTAGSSGGSVDVVDGAVVAGVVVATVTGELTVVAGAMVAAVSSARLASMDRGERSRHHRRPAAALPQPRRAPASLDDRGPMPLTRRSSGTTVAMASSCRRRNASSTSTRRCTSVSIAWAA